MATKSSSSKKSASAKTTTVTSVKTKKGGFLKDTPLAGMGIAEFVGTFLLTASIFAVQGQPLFVAFALIGIVLIFGGISGAHLNPAITVGALATKKIKSKRAIVYIVAQILGALAAFALFSGFLSATVPAAETTEAVYSNSQQLFHVVDISADESGVQGKEWVLFAAELIGVFALSLGVSVALREKKERVAAAAGVGLALLIGLLLASSITSVLLTESNTTLTFLNPAVALSGYFAGGISMFDLWPLMIFVVAPLVGGVLGFGLSDLLEKAEKDSATA